MGDAYEEQIHGLHETIRRLREGWNEDRDRLKRLESALQEIRKHACWLEDEHDGKVEPDEDDMIEALTTIFGLTNVLFGEPIHTGGMKR